MKVYFRCEIMVSHLFESECVTTNDQQQVPNISHHAQCRHTQCARPWSDKQLGAQHQAKRNGTPPNPDLAVQLTTLMGGVVEGFAPKVKSLEDPEGEVNPRTRTMTAGDDKYVCE